MRGFRPQRDEIDAVLGDEHRGDDDLIVVAQIVHSLRSAYVPEERLPRHPALAAFTEARPADVATPATTVANTTPAPAAPSPGEPSLDHNEEGRRSMSKVLAALTATVAGKVVLGTAVAAASVGGLHAADVVDVPGLPDQADEQAITATEDAGTDDGTDNGAAEEADPESTDTEPEATEAESDFSLAMQEWSDCVDQASAEHDEAMADYDASVDGPPGRFDPEEECGDRPTNPAVDGDQGQPEEIDAFVTAVQDWSDCVAENAPDHDAACTRPEAPASEQGDVSDDAPEGTPDGQPEGTPDGQPEGTPEGQPEGTPDGQPEETPDSQPEETPDGQPEETPDGQPEATPDGPPEGTPAG